MRACHAPLAMMPFARIGSRPISRTRSAPAKMGFPDPAVSTGFVHQPPYRLSGFSGRVWRWRIPVDWRQTAVTMTGNGGRRCHRPPGGMLRLPTGLNARLVDRLIISIVQRPERRELCRCGAETRATLAISTEMAMVSAANRRADNAGHASGAGRGL